MCAEREGLWGCGGVGCGCVGGGGGSSRYTPMVNPDHATHGEQTRKQEPCLDLSTTTQLGSVIVAAT
jgi:hypothetical protein